jgi:hypothetical protein
MAIISSKTERREKKCGCHDTKPCEDPVQDTQKIHINTERRKYCEALYSAAGDVNKWQKAAIGEKTLYERKKCNLVYTEQNYQRYRNTQICLGTELMQTTELIKDNVKQYVEWGGKLSGLLKDIFKGVKEAKIKMNELNNAAQVLDNSKKDKCYDAEWRALLGDVFDPCTPEKQPQKTPPNYPEKCSEADKNICDILCMTSALYSDVNSIFKASSEVVGIQVFSNIGTLDPIQKGLADKAKTFDGYLQEVAKAREGDMKKAQETLVKSVQETTKANGVLYGSRSTFEGLKDTTTIFCCPPCNCIPKEDPECGTPRLTDCECCICTICGQVQETFCGHSSSQTANAI